MKINFYAIYSEDKEKNKFRASLSSKIVERVINTSDHACEVDGHFLLMHQIDDNTFLLTKTYDSELVKKINTKTLTVDDIKESLATDESLGFPSFLHVKDDIIGFAHSFYGPRTRDLASFISAKKIVDVDTHKVIIEPLLRDMSNADVMKMSFVGRTTLRAEAGSGVTVGVLRALGMIDIDEELLDGIEITIKPKRSKDIKNLSKGIINNENNDFSDIHIKAREEAADILTDYYLSGKGHLNANIYKSSNAEVAEEMLTCFIRMKRVIMDSYAMTVGDDLRDR